MQTAVKTGLIFSATYFNSFLRVSQVVKTPIYLRKRRLQWYDYDMIQDIAPHRFDNRFIPGRQPSPDSIALLFCGEDLLLRRMPDNSFSLCTYNELSEAVPEISSCPCFFLFALDGTDWFLIYEKDASAVSWELEGNGSSDVNHDKDHALLVRCSLTALRRQQLLPRHKVFAALTAAHLNRWYHENRYCGTCAAETAHAPDERAMECPSCKRRIYPKIMPAVIVAVTNGDEIVLTRYANRPFAYHALVAGFNEIGETLEETVRREVMEEIGLKVKNIRYYKSQPWAIAGDVLAGYFCDVDGDPAIRVDEQELKEALWVKREDVDGQPDDFSLTNEMMMVFKAGKEPRA